jgi:hypothetical protein
MKQFLLLPETAFAGHCTVGGSNKVWAACLACETDTSSSTREDVAEVFYLCVYGAYGARLRVEPPQRLPRSQAQALLQKKCREKRGKGYQPVAFASFLSSFVYPDGATLLLPNEQSAGTSESVRASSARRAESTTCTDSMIAPTLFRYSATPVKALSWAQLQEKQSDPAYGFSEKANGERCLLEFNGEQLVAYNRRGQRTGAPPAGALPLASLRVPFVLDGERVPATPVEQFVAFDLLEWNGEDLRERPYHARLSWLSEQMSQARLLTAPLWTPTVRQSLENSLVPGLALLGSVRGEAEKTHLIDELLRGGGEGIIVRKLTASAQNSPWKYKFQADLDAFVYAIEPGLAGGSLKLGVLRPADQAVIAIGHVRSGLTVEDLRAIEALLARRQFPVCTVHYLPARTIGFHLVEPHTSISLLRADKLARECTTDQFGEEKAALLAQAKAVSGIHVH